MRLVIINKTFILLLICALSLICFSTMNGQGAFSDASEVSILEASPGNELYSGFGHCGIRVKDPTRNIDVVFDYGVFDFDSPNFYGKFIRGKLLYQLAVRDFSNYWASYGKSDQMVTSYNIQLDSLQKRAFISSLLENYKPENRKYLYDFFYDNCATRIRDLIETSADRQLVVPEEVPTDLKLRDLLHYSLQSKPWSAYGIDIVLGLEADKTANQRRRVFIPFWLSQTLAKYQIKDSNSTRSVLGDPVILKEGKPISNPPLWAGPLFIVSLCCSLILFLTFIFPGRAGLIDKILFSLIGLAGLFILFLWFGTDHMATKDNLNVLWLSPLYLLLLGFHKKRGPTFRVTALILLAINIFVMAGNSWIWPQYVHPGFYPILGLLTVRLVFNLKRKDLMPKP